MTKNPSKRSLVLLTIPSIAALSFLPLAGCGADDELAAPNGAEDGVDRVDSINPGGPTSVLPWSPEVCDGRDNDWDDEVDEEDPNVGLSCVTGQAGICSPGTLACVSGALTCVPDTEPQAEDCNTPEDEDCDGFGGCQSSGHIWSKQFTGTRHTAGTAIAVDPSGNIIVGADFEDPVDFGAGLLTSKSGHDGVVMKRDPNGNLLWLRHFGATNMSRVSYVSTDSAGDIYVAGNFGGTIDLGLGPVTGYPTYGNFYIVKLAPNGTTIWQRTFNHTGEEAILVVPDHAGDLIVSGSFWEPIDFGTGLVTAFSAEDGFVIKLDANGNTLWTRVITGKQYQYAAVQGVDLANNPVVSVNYITTVDTGSGPIASAGGFDSVLAKLDTATGNTLWTRHYGGSGDDWVHARVDATGDIIASAWFSGTLDLGGGPLTSNGYDALVARLDGSGNFVWQKRIGGPGDQMAYPTIDNAGNWLIHGSYWGGLDYGAGPVPSASTNNHDAYVLKLNPSGTPLWFHRYGDAAYEYISSSAVDAAGNFVFTGGHGGTVDFGGGPFTSADFRYDMFLVKLAP
ncbi:hypothetical protein [Polyangium aurulentum]|uniref:hypothetical protein n=1 Tax=Polyangium aurulentum TaxID=2567896 RepID=UPI0010ADABC4|nr:hypothetical protein [Polyangium aurulentum]UQA62807.1 hypothetical protein E8A73_021085 [Polyangium aurulentum]